MTRKRAASAWLLGLVAVGTGGCLSKADPQKLSTAQCTTQGAFERLSVDSKNSAGAAYQAPAPVVQCPLLDRPPDGNKAAPGVVFEEYAALVDGTHGNFFDDNSWWLKALPRGEVHTEPLELIGEGCQEMKFEDFSYDYAALTPPLASAPACGRYLAGLAVGRRFGRLAPQIMQVEATAYLRLGTLGQLPTFGTSFRFASQDAAQSGESFPILRQVQIVGHDAEALRFVGRLSGSSFEGAFSAELVPGARSELHVQSRMYLRPDVNRVELGALALSSMFWKGAADTPDVNSDEAHDADRVVVELAGQAPQTVMLTNPATGGIHDYVVTRLAEYSADPVSVSLVQGERDATRYASYVSARYADRPTIELRDVHANAPLAVDLAVAHTDSEFIDNVVVNFVVNTSQLADASGPLDVSYVLVSTMDE